MSIIIRYFLLFIAAIAAVLPIPAQLLFESPQSLPQVTPALTYGAKESKKKEFTFGGYWSAARQMPPLPFNPFPELPVYDVGSNTFVYDDRKVDYPALRAQWSAEQAEREAAEGATGLRGPGGAAAMMMSGYSGLWLELEVVDDYALLTLHNTEPGTNYQIFSSTDVAAPANQWTLEQTLVGVDGQDTTRTVFQRLGRTNLFFKAASAAGGDPALHLTEVRQPMLPEPFIQIRGYTERALSLIHFKVESLTLGAAQNRGWVTKQHYDFKTYQLTTNWWQCFDVELFPGFNRVTISVVDREGNTNRTTLHYAVAFLPNRPPPQVLGVWPAPGARVPGSQVNLRGTLDNPTAKVTASVTPGGNSGGATQTINGVVERDGTFWVDNVNLTEGDNEVSLVVTDAGGLSATNQWTITNLPELEFSASISMPGDYFLTINGQVPNTGYTVTINGAPAQVLSNSGFSETVPIPSANSGGPAVFHVVAVGGGQTLELELIYERPQRIYLFAYDREQILSEPWTECDTGAGGGSIVESISTTNLVQWEKYVGGQEATRTRFSTNCDVQNPPPHPFGYGYDEVLWNGIEQRIYQGGTNNSQVNYDWESCSGTAQHDYLHTPPGVELRVEHLRHAQSQLHLRSGGRSTAKRSKLLRFDGLGETFTPNSYAPNVDTNNLDLWSWWPFSTATTNYALAPMGLLGGTLPTNQPLFVSVPAGVDIDATPTVAGEVVKFNHLTVADATPRLSNGLNTPVPEGVDPALVEERLKEQSPSASNPGRIIFVNNGDADHDGVPNFADGYGLHGASTPDSGGRFAPITLTLPSTINPSVAKIRFSYQAAEPGNVVATPGPGGTYTTYAPGGSGLRLWSKDGSASRLPDPVSGSVGDFIPSGQPIELAWLLPAPLPSSGASLTIYAEAVNASGSAGDLVVTVSVDPDGDAGPAGYEGTDFVRFTALDITLAEAQNASSATPTDTFKESLPTPVISANCQFSNVGPSDDGSVLLADVTVSGTISSALCDITAGNGGIINHVFLYLNGLGLADEAGGVSVSVQKSTNLTSLTRPYPYSGSFTRTYYDVPVNVGDNVLRATATDPTSGVTGYAELTGEVTATDTQPNQNEGVSLLYHDLRARLNFGSNVHSLTDFTPTTPVQLTFEVVSRSQTYSGALYPLVLTNNVLLLGNGAAWVTITDANSLNSYLDTNTQGAGLLAEISVPSLAPPGLLFDLQESAANTGLFTNDYVGLAMGFSGALNDASPDTIVARVVRVPGQSVSNLLTETGNNTLLFETADHSFHVQLGQTSAFVSTNYDRIAATVTSTTLGLTNLALETYETGTNTLVFDADDEVEPGGTDLGLYFGATYSASGFTQTGASDGGELHLHFAQFQGPADVIDFLSQFPNSPIVKGPDGKYYLANSEGAPTALLGLSGYPDSQVSTNCDGSFAGGFASGVFGGVKGFVWDGWESLGEAVSERTLVPVTELSFDVYSVISGSLNSGEFLSSWNQRFHRAAPVTARLANYIYAQAQNPSGDFQTMAFGLLEEGVAAASDEIKRQSDEVQQGMVLGANLLSKLYDDLQNGCPGRRGQIIGRAGFELITFYAGIAKLNQVTHAAQAAKVTEVALLTKVAQSSSVPEIQQAATLLLNTGGANSWNTVDFLKELARRSENKIGGTGTLSGKFKHTYAEKLLERYQNRYGNVGNGLATERTYLNGVYRGQKIPELGSVIVDVVEGPLNAPSAIYDYKFGATGLTPKRIQRIRRHVGNSSIPVIEIRP